MAVATLNKVKIKNNLIQPAALVANKETLAIPSSLVVDTLSQQIRSPLQFNGIHYSSQTLYLVHILLSPIGQCELVIGSPQGLQLRLWTTHSINVCALKIKASLKLFWFARSAFILS